MQPIQLFRLIQYHFLLVVIVFFFSKSSNQDGNNQLYSETKGETENAEKKNLTGKQGRQIASTKRKVALNSTQTEIYREST